MIELFKDRDFSSVKFSWRQLTHVNNDFKINSISINQCLFEFDEDGILVVQFRVYSDSLVESFNHN